MLRRRVLTGTGKVAIGSLATAIACLILYALYRMAAP